MKRLVACLILSLISPLAFADAAAQGPSMISNIVMLVGFLAIFYFLLIRPQSKRAKEHQNLISSLAKDDEVVLNGGLVGKIKKVGEQFIVLTIAEGIEVKVQRQAIASSLPKGTLNSI